MNKVFYQLFWLAIILSAPCMTRAGDVIYVSPSGNDGNPGSADKPLASLQKAVDRAVAQSTPQEIILRAGVYPAGLRIAANTNKNVNLPTLVIRAERKKERVYEDVIIDGGQVIKQATEVAGRKSVYAFPSKFSTSSEPNLWENDTRIRYTLMADEQSVEAYPASFFFKEKEIVFHTSDGQLPEKHDLGLARDHFGISVQRSNVTLQGLQFRNFLLERGSGGVSVNGAEIRIEDCRVWNSMRGFGVGQDAVNARIIRCRADDVGCGVFSYGKNTIVEDGRFFRKAGPFEVQLYSQDQSGIQCYYPAQGGEMRRNLCVGFNLGLFFKCPESRFVAENNTVISPGSEYGIGCTSWHPDSVFRYNIVVGFDNPLLGGFADLPLGVVIDDNCYWSSANWNSMKGALESPRAAVTGRHNAIADPLFVAPETNDYRIVADGVCARMGPDGAPIGALGVVPNGEQDRFPPTVSLTALSPAVNLGVTCERYFEGDWWNPKIGGGVNLVSANTEPGQNNAWIVPERKVTLKINAWDSLGVPRQMRWRQSSASAWEQPEPFQPIKVMELTASRLNTQVQVADEGGNWSEPQEIQIIVSDKPPQLKAAPVQYLNSNGVILIAETDVPCRVQMEWGPDTNYGCMVETPKDVRSNWDSQSGGEWKDVRDSLKTRHLLALVDSKLKKGSTIHYRLMLDDSIGHQARTLDAMFVPEGKAITRFLSPDGEDVEGGGTQGKPWKTLQFAVDRALPGDTIRMKAGLYTDTEAMLTHGGTEQAPLTIEAEKGAKVVLDGGKAVEVCLRLNDAQYVNIRGLEIRWFDGTGVYISQSSHVTLEECTFWNRHWNKGRVVGNGLAARRSPYLKVDHCLFFALNQAFCLIDSPSFSLTYNTAARLLHRAGSIIYSAAGSRFCNNSFTFTGNVHLTVETSKDDLKSFVSDYNNLAMYIRKETPRRPLPEEDIQPKPNDFFRYQDSKGVMSLNEERMFSLREWQEKTGLDKHSIYKHPRYADPFNRDFRLKPDSPNIGAGENGTTIGALGVVEKIK